MRRLPIACLLIAGMCAGCGGSAVMDPGDPSDPRFELNAFDARSAQILFNYFPLTPGTARSYRGTTEEGEVVGLFEVTDATREVAGVLCRVARERTFVDGALVEDTHDWYAQDIAGNVWVLGETTVDYEGGQPLPGTTGWEAGVNGAQAGILIKIAPVVGDTYPQEVSGDGLAERARVIALGITLTLRDGSTHEQCLQMLEWKPSEEGSEVFKWYAPSLGLIRESHPDGSQAVEWISP